MGSKGKKRMQRKKSARNIDPPDPVSCTPYVEPIVPRSGFEPWNSRRTYRVGQKWCRAIVAKNAPIARGDRKSIATYIYREAINTSPPPQNRNSLSPPICIAFQGTHQHHLSNQSLTPQPQNGAEHPIYNTTTTTPLNRDQEDLLI